MDNVLMWMTRRRSSPTTRAGRWAGAVAAVLCYLLVVLLLVG
ncbi:hypothetical protein BJY16_000048 [Actinoplanes octamycinicus]|uniref:Uncharacterized protein n=1 Tax=Actinoplanes octamycinicus TaxID=135948 RepID=A0A7W7GQT8_9ACTN|nr:hypothetical protein [Actinoplanes octamycinicus]MBB4736589.1 hypothetical protein [Actinoplanes octamycinicus]